MHFDSIVEPHRRAPGAANPRLTSRTHHPGARLNGPAPQGARLALIGGGMRGVAAGRAAAAALALAVVAAAWAGAAAQQPTFGVPLGVDTGLRLIRQSITNWDEFAAANNLSGWGKDPSVPPCLYTSVTCDADGRLASVCVPAHCLHATAAGACCCWRPLLQRLLLPVHLRTAGRLVNPPACRRPFRRSPPRSPARLQLAAVPRVPGQG